MLYNKAIGATASAQKIYIEDVFSTYLYTGNGSTQTITNGIDLSGKNGLTWIKGRSGATGHRFTDTVRGATKSLESNSTAAEIIESTGVTSFNSTSFALGADADYNTNGAAYVSWTFRKAAKFFDVVTFTTSSTNTNKRISHSLGSAPGLIIIKSTNTTSNWIVYHRSLGRSNYLVLDSSTIAIPSANIWGTSDPTSADFGLDETQFDAATWVAYLFAHDAGGFGDSGNDNVISCGSYTGNGSTSGPTVTLGWEPQWLLVKRSSSTGDWNLIDNLRGFVVGGADAELNPNLGNAESTGTFVSPLATGFQLNTTDAGYNASGGTYIYIAIRRGPMKTPTDPTKVFALSAGQNDTSPPVTQPGFPVDAAFSLLRTASDKYVRTRLTGGGFLGANTQNPESVSSYSWASNTDLSAFFLVGSSTVYQMFHRAPAFFDVVAYTGTGSARTVSHNLGVAPELMIVKRRSAFEQWTVYSSALGATRRVELTENSFRTSSDRWNDTSPTSSVFTVATHPSVNNSLDTYVAYLFATCPGVSKVGSYTGTGTTLNVDCGFTNGARFVLIKRTDSTGDWYVWDTARGINSANDPYLLLNSTAAEVTNTDYIDPLSAGFQISSTAPADINANGGSYIYLSVA